jgi:hypothetical protein
MKAHYRAFSGKLVIEVEGASVKDLFAAIGPFAEVLDGDDSCGKCASPHIYPRAREAKGFVYYELVCSDCRAKLSFGQHKDGDTLWAKREDEQGNALPFRGWTLYLGLPEAPKPAGTPAPTKRPQAQAAPRPTTTLREQSEFDKRLAGFLKRANSESEVAQILGEMCDAIDGLAGNRRDVADYVWTEALKQFGDPSTNPKAVAPVIKHLLHKIVELERGVNK